MARYIYPSETGELCCAVDVDQPTDRFITRHDLGNAGSLQALIDYLCERRNRIPEQYRKNAAVKISSEYGESDPECMCIYIAYQRPATEEEKAEAAAEDEERKQEKEAEERAELQRLKEKYE